MRSCGRLEYGAMAIFHLQVNTVSRSAGRSATAAAAYRAGERIVDEQTGEIHDYTRKGGVEASALFAPADAPEWAADRTRLWNAAEAAERRKNSTVAREFVVALPAELSAEDRQALAFDLGRALVARHGVAVDVCIHAPGNDGDERNHHAHILMTTRRMAREGLTEKTRELDNQRSGEVDHWRAEWARLANAALERAGRAERIDHRTLEEQGIERMPTTHQGPAVTDMLRKGRQSDVADRQAEQAGQFDQAKREAAAAAVDLAKVQQLLDQAQEAAAHELAEQKRQQEWQERLRRESAAAKARDAEDKRLRSLSSEELAREVSRMRKAIPSPDSVARRDPDYVAAKKRSEDLAEKQEKARQMVAKAERHAEALREKHGIRAWLHDAGLRRFRQLDETAAIGQQAEQRALQLAPQVVQAEAAAKAAYNAAESRQWLENAPHVDRADRYAKLAQEKVREEVQAKERAKAEARLLAQREQDAADWVEIAAMRRTGREDMHDGGSKWEMMPVAVRKLVDAYNRSSKDVQQKLLADIRAKDRQPGPENLMKALGKWSEEVLLRSMTAPRQQTRSREYGRGPSL